MCAGMLAWLVKKLTADLKIMLLADLQEERVSLEERQSDGLIGLLGPEACACAPRTAG